MSNCRHGISGAAAFLLLILAAHAAYGQADSVLTAHRQALSRLQGMIDGREALSFERAVFITENAWHGGTLDSAAFDLTLRSMAALAERAGRSVPVRNEEHERPLAIQYALYQLLKDTLKVATPQGVFRTAPYLYNIDDFDGRRDWSGQFVTRLVEEGRGTCRSLPYLYQILSERLGVESWLAFAPSHVYVKHRDAGQRREGWQQRMYNVELTNGSFPTDGWLMASGYITLKAIQHGLFMRRLEGREAVAQCAVDLAGGYARKTGRLTDGFAASCAALALSVDTLNPNARLLEIRVARAVWEASGKKTDLAKLESLCRRLAALGYREMPAQMYLNWLFELRTAKNPLDSVRYRPKRFPKPDSLNGLPVLTLTDGYFDEFPDWADSTRMAGVIFDLKKKKVAGIVHEPDSIRRGESWTPSRWLSTDPIHHPYQSPYTAFDGNPIFFVDPNGTSAGWWVTQSGRSLGHDGKGDDQRVFVVEHISDNTEMSTEDLSTLREIHDKGATIPFTSTYELPTTKSQLLQVAATAFAEASESRVWEEIAGIANVIVNYNPVAYGSAAQPAKRLLSTSDEARNGTFMQTAVGAAINAVRFKHCLGPATDYSEGASQWDGRDVLTDGSKNHFRYRPARFDTRQGIYVLEENMIHVSNFERNVQSFLKNNSLRMTVNTKTRLGSLWEVTQSHGQTIFYKEIKPN